jgi:orotidine-5'-phosphate decarboxylase
MTRQELTEQIYNKGSYLCIGLDSDIEKIPARFLKQPDPVFEFNKEVVDSTRELCVSYKINTAFYEANGARGWETLEKTVKYIGNDHFKIADAKRGDIGNTSRQYAKAFFETLAFDAVTVAPYMGADSVKPFLEFKGKWAILLGLTSNPGANDFEMLKTGDDFLFEKVIKTSAEWGDPGNMMFVIGATRFEQVKKVRQLIPDHFLLVPGVGAQGGSLEEISIHGMTGDCGLLVNVSRDIIFAANPAEAAGRYKSEMETYLSGKSKT